jgi:Asp-tRNA(Asn)/Glu-tRNA(Gln) amidotransferase A subunit family amidase
MGDFATTRRRFLGYFSGLGLTSTLLPGALWARMQEQQAAEVTSSMILQSAAVSGLELTEEQAGAMAEGVNRNLQGYAALREFKLDHEVGPPIHFNPLVPGMTVDREERPFRPSSAEGLQRPVDLEDVAFWPLMALAELIRTGQVTSTELTEMYLARLKRLNPTLNCVVTFTDELAMAEAERADRALASGTYLGLLHGIPWGAKDIIAVRGYPTTWGSNTFKDQETDFDATVVTRLREAGAVLIAKLTTGELASGDRWFGGRTRNPWDPSAGSSGSSAGPASATVAGCVGFAIGTETSGSILSPSIACGATGLRPTFGRVSRYGAMTLRWTGDRLGPICRTAEDCAVVFRAISGPDPRDPSVLDIPFNWDAELDMGALRVGYLEDAFADDPSKEDDWKANDQAALDQLRTVGIRLESVATPLRDFPLDALRPLSAESTAAFDRFLREGRETELGRPERGARWRVGRTIPAVEYLQAQRVRSTLMTRLYEALRDVDVIVAPYGDARGYLRGEQPGGRASGGARPQRRPATSQFFQLANHACYPAVAVRHGLGEGGLPTGFTFVGKPFAENLVLAMAKRYQDLTSFHLERPPLGG